MHNRRIAASKCLISCQSSSLELPHRHLALLRSLSCNYRVAQLSTSADHVYAASDMIGWKESTTKPAMESRTKPVISVSLRLWLTQTKSLKLQDVETRLHAGKRGGGNETEMCGCSLHLILLPSSISKHLERRK